MLQFLCRERDGEFVRTVSPMQRTLPHILDTIERLGTVPNLLDPKNPAAIFLDPSITILEVYDVGIFAVSNFLGAEGGAHVHATFWDRKLRGREEMCRALAALVVEIRRQPLHTAVREDRAVLLAFCKRVGFVELRRSQTMVILRFANYTA